jgi:hypothetical protein
MGGIEVKEVHAYWVFKQTIAVRVVEIIAGYTCLRFVSLGSARTNRSSTPSKS